MKKEEEAANQPKVKLSEDDELSHIEKNPDIYDQSMSSTFHSKPPLAAAALKQAQGRSLYDQPSASSHQKYISTQADSALPEKALEP